MSSLAMSEGWNMIGTGPKGSRSTGAWREVGIAWAVTLILAGALLLTVPRHERQGPPAKVWSLSSAASTLAHRRAPDPESPASDEACSDRDYANELC